MFERLKRLFENGQITDVMIFFAAEKGWITNGQAAEIIGESEETANDNE